MIGFELYMDDGIGGGFFNTDTGEIMYKPYLKSYQVTRPSQDTGKAFRIYLRALNMIGYVDSAIIRVIQSGVPPKPSAAPTTNLGLTNAKQIYVYWTAPAANGGSDILTYELQNDDGKGGDFVSVIGYDQPYLKLWYVVETNISKGTTYRFRYRAQNRVGWSTFSDTAYIQAANVPVKPPVPVYVSSTSDSITLQFAQTVDNGGTPVTGYKLLRDAGNDFGSSF